MSVPPTGVSVGLVGLGKMGGGMARNLLGAGYALTVLDLNREAVAAAVAAGATAASSAGALASPARDVVILSLPTITEVEAVLFGSDGLLQGRPEGLLIVDTTTMLPQESIALAARVAEHGSTYVEAPVSGGPLGAANGQLAVMLAGSQTAATKAEQVLQAIGTDITYVGPHGSASTIKVINQAIFVSYLEIFAEGLALGEAAGVPLETLLKILGASMAGRPEIEKKFDEIRGLKTSGFPTANALRYLKMAESTFGSVGTRAPGIKAVRESLSRAVERGLGRQDIIVARSGYLGKDPV